nr:retrovirus-related Pol polyprotein from transposon TNT 1-94 [Tanacetum cinerariifolium]
MRVEENLHINFLENKPNVVGKGPTWLFDLDYLTDSMNYQPVTSENKTNKTAGLKEANNNAEAKNEDEKLNDDTGLKTNEEPVDQEDQAFLEELERLKIQEHEADDAIKTLRKTFAKSTKDLLLQEGVNRASSTKYVNTASIPVNTASTPVNTTSPLRNVSAAGSFYPDLLTYANQDDYHIPSLEDIYEVPSDGIFTSESYDDEGAMADFKNLESTVNVDAMQKELLQFKTQQVWILVDLPFRKKVVGTKWVYRNKKDEQGVLIRIKASHQDLFGLCLLYEIHSLSDGCEKCLLVWKIDEEVYFSQPPGFIDPKFPKKVYKVVKALYGLHQAPRAWYATLYTFLVKSGYRSRIIDKNLFIKKEKKDIMLVQVYVDDIIFGSTKKSWCDEFEASMKSRFQMSSMGELTFFLGLQVKQSEDGIFISQDKYAVEILKKFDFMSVKTASTLIKTKKPLVKHAEAADVDVHLYRSMISSLMYLTASRPDIMYAVCTCFRFQVTLKTSHLHAVKRIFRYLKGQPKLGIWYPRESAFDLEAYSDSDYAGVNLDRKSTTEGGKAKTRLNVEEGNFNKLDDLVGKGADYDVNEGRSTDKIKVLNTEAEGVSAAGETLSTATLVVSTVSVQRRKAGSRMKRMSKRQKTDVDLKEEEQLRVFLNIILDEEREVDYARQEVSIVKSESEAVFDLLRFI